MALTTTTVAAIIRNFVTVVEGLTPAGTDVSELSKVEFRRAPAHRPAGDGVQSSAALRRFEIVPIGPRVDASVMDPAAALVERECRMTVTYPGLLGLYGARHRDDLHALVEADAVVIRDALASPGNQISGQLATHVTQSAVTVTGDDVWLSVLEFVVQYYQAQTLT